ncbi:transporter, major facilitator family protein [Lactobacillus kalixensis DSM 16043]|uniref:Transporter, major facilitator family protein n=2 Tax=Lactobacillus kalixensis TaxID=227944 RepID=A0A0R1UDK5_9LACO|nr:transporter, major facilitator family protein [Lactobacillus kalixensis DSM 16043]
MYTSKQHSEKRMTMSLRVYLGQVRLQAVMLSNLTARSLFMYSNTENAWINNFYRLFVGQGLATVISATANYSLTFYLTADSKSAIILTLSEMISLLPIALFSPFAGVLADQISKKKVLILSDLISIIITLLLFFKANISNNSLTVTLILITQLVRAIAISVQNPTIQSSIPELVPKDRLLTINGQNSSLQALNQFLPPILGGILYGILPVDKILLLSALANIVGIISVAITHFHEGKSNKIIFNPFSELKKGIKIILSKPILSKVIIYKAISVAIITPCTALYPLMTSEHFHGSLKFDAPLVEVAIALGMGLSGIWIGKLNNISHKLLPTAIGFVGIGCVLLLSGLLPGNRFGFTIFVVINFLAGFQLPLIDAPIQTLLQSEVAQDNLGKVISLYLMVIGLAGPLGLGISGIISNSIPTSLHFVISGILLVVMFVIGMCDSGFKNI